MAIDFMEEEDIFLSMKKHNRGFINGGICGGAVWEAKPILMFKVVRGRDLDAVIKQFIRDNFHVFRNAHNPKKQKRFGGG